MKSLLSALTFLLVLSFQTTAQSSLAKYGNDFLSTGAGARALGMGSAHSSLTSDVTAGYWNVAGLSKVTEPQAIYMLFHYSPEMLCFQSASFVRV